MAEEDPKGEAPPARWKSVSDLQRLAIEKNFGSGATLSQWLLATFVSINGAAIYALIESEVLNPYIYAALAILVLGIACACVSAMYRYYTIVTLVQNAYDYCTHLAQEQAYVTYSEYVALRDGTSGGDAIVADENRRTNSRIDLSDKLYYVSLACFLIGCLVGGTAVVSAKSAATDDRVIMKFEMSAPA